MGGISREEFKTIFQNCYEPVRNFLYYKTGEMETAEDIVQDVFLKLWEIRDSVKIETVKSLAFKIANNLFLNRLDHKKVQLKFTSSYNPDHSVERPDFILELKEFDSKLQLAINSLDEGKKTVFLMNRIDKMTYNEIAANLGISVKAVEKRMGKALAFLKKEIEMNI